MSKNVLFCVLLFVFVLLSSYADEVRIHVVDKDLDIPLEGVMLSTHESGNAVFTDIHGDAILPVPENTSRIVILAQLVGYEARRILVHDFSTKVTIALLMEGVLEGEELVVLEKAIGQSDEEVGTSTVIKKDIIEASARMGIIEDVMSAVKILPGVSYSGGFNSYLSVRGGTPGELTAVMDGFVVKYPYHWGGGFSIFNPNIVESVKFSPGIFSVKYGDASSGLLEITTVTPDNGLKFSFVESISTLESFLEMPLGESGGLFAGFRLTNYDLSFQLTKDTMEESGMTFSRVPYIYDGYVKAFYRPHNGFEWYLNAFIGNDGIGMQVVEDTLENNTDIAMDFDFRYSNTDFFVNSGIKWMATGRFLVHILGGYEYWLASVNGMFHEYGSREYSQDFIDSFSPSDTGYSLDIQSLFDNDVTNQGIQLRADTDFAVNTSLIWQNGGGFFYDISTVINSGSFYILQMLSDDEAVYFPANYSSEADETSVLKSFLYSNLSWKNPGSRISLDAGIRVDHSFFWNTGNLSINTWPIANPRINMRYAFDSNGGFFDDQTLSLGTGFFSKTPFDALGITEEMGIEDFDISPPRTFMTVLGWETKLPSSLRFRIEGYYKYLFNMFYINSLADASENSYEIVVKNDGIGHAAGFDILLDRKTSRYWDGMLSYSFIFARYRDPSAEGLDVSNTENPDGWYFPYFHRFHTLNFLLDMKPANWLTFTTKLSFATGSPLETFGERQMFLATVQNSDSSVSIAEMYRRESIYSDSHRTWFSLPLDLKLTFHNYYKNSRVGWEFYIAAEDILSYTLAKLAPKDSTRTNMYTGEDTQAPSSDFSFIMLSVGGKFSY